MKEGADYWIYLTRIALANIQRILRKRVAALETRAPGVHGTPTSLFWVRVCCDWAVRAGARTEG